MKIYTRILLDIETGKILESDSLEYSGLVELCCGASQQQTNLATAQSNFYNQMTQEANQIYGEGSQVASMFMSEFGPIFEAGPNQLGWSPAEAAAVNSQILTSGVEAISNAEKASVGQTNALSGGNEYTPQGAVKEIEAGINVSGQQQIASQQVSALEANYAQGLQNFNESASALSGIPSIMAGGTSTAQAATQSGAATGQTLQDINQAKSGWMNLAGAGLGAAGAIISG